MKQALLGILNEVLEKDPPVTEISEHCDLIEVFGLNSLEMMQFIVKIEDVFQVEFDLSQFDLAYFNDLSVLMDFIKSQQAIRANE